MTFKDPYYGYSTSSGTFSTTSATTMYYPDRYGYVASGGGFVSDREVYYREMAQKLQEELRHYQRMVGSPIQFNPAPLESPKPKEPDNIAWLSKRVDEIVALGKLAA